MESPPTLSHALNTLFWSILQVDAQFWRVGGCISVLYQTINRHVYIEKVWHPFSNQDSDEKV